MRVGVLGINHKLAELELRELLAQTCQRRLTPNQAGHGPQHFVLLSTCNRTEVYFSSDELADTHSYLLSLLRNDVEEDDFDQKLYSYFGQDCLQHLCRVTAGLDSAIVAETEIQGQVKAAYESSKLHNELPYELHYLFQKSLGISKKVRSVLPLKPGLPDLEHAILQAGQHLFPNFEQARVLFVGASEINEKILEHLKGKGLNNITLCNRSEDKGRLLALKHKVPFTSWKALKDCMDYDWIILGTKAPGFLITSSHLTNAITTPKLIIDLCVPRNVDPTIGTHPHVNLLNIDQINQRLDIRKQEMQRSLSIAEDLILSAIEHQMELFKDKEFHRLRIAGSAIA